MSRTEKIGVAIALLLYLTVPGLALPQPASVNPGAAEYLLQTGNTHFQAGKLEAAIQVWQQALQQFRQTKNSGGEMQTALRLGAALVSVERHQEAIPILERGLTLTQQLQDGVAQAQTLGNLGIAYQSLGNYASAIATHRQAGKLMLELGDRRSLGQVLTNLGNIFEAVGDYSNATIAFQQSLKIAQQTGDRMGESVALGNLGAIYANQGKDQEALATLQQSLDLAKTIDYLPGQTSALLNLGSTHHALRQLESAVSFYQASLQLARTTGNRQREAEALGALGLAYEDQTNFAVAIRHHQQSLAIGRSLNNPEIQGQALNNLGHTLFKANKLAEAERILRQAIQLLDALRPDLTDNYKVSIFDTQLHTYSLLQQVLVAANKHEAALEAAEWGRARAFAERLARRIGGKPRSQGANLKPQASTLSPALRPIKMADIRRIAKEQRATLVEYAIVPDDAFKFRGKQRGRESELLIWVVQPSGQLHFRRVDLKPLWQQDLNLAKLVTVSRNCLYPPFNCQEVAAPAPSATQLSVGQTAKAETATKPVRRVNPALHRLHQLLMQPIADLLPQRPEDQIIILPLESLFLVPFPALQTASGQYLIEQHTVSTAPAIQVLALTRQIRQQRPEQGIRDRLTPALIVGNPTMPTIDAQELAPLPAAEAEAQEIASLLNVKAITGRAATQQRVTAQMAQASLVHLATHGLLEYGETLGETDLPGAIALAPDPLWPKSHTTPNGILTARDILELRLRANLVVLSACDTGRGRITGDGVQGLSRAFIAAGVPSLVVSLWAVPDASTAYLMVNFYQKLLQQPDKAKALRSAMLETMQRYPRPLDWAAFTLIGEAR
ncbi:MAG: CHAT domain-containing protein [Leptolyngbyaceae cyanobacterium bins.349]|nr:CHAT domain-containing protein [Leptolyngbyaceae cyanobacterium bins.349]